MSEEFMTAIQAFVKCSRRVTNMIQWKLFKSRLIAYQFFTIYNNAKILG